MSHVKLNSAINQTQQQVKITEAKIEKFSDSVTEILRSEAAAKSKKLVYVFINVNQSGPTSFSVTIDDSRDKISEAAANSIKKKFDETFGMPTKK